MNGIHGFSGQYRQGWYGWWGKKEQAERVEAFPAKALSWIQRLVRHIDAEMQVQRSPALLVGVSGGVDLPKAPIHGFSEFLHEWIV